MCCRLNRTPVLVRVASLLVLAAAPVLAQEGAEGDTLAAWRQDLDARTQDGMLDVALADDFIRAVYAPEAPPEAEAHHTFAADVYLWLLRSLDYGPPPDARARLARHLEALRWVMPPDVAARAGEAGAGEMLAGWWRSQDPLPATPANERVEEHLRRVAYTEVHFQKDGRPDDRARIYVRYGPPAKRAKIRFNSREFRDKVLFRSLTLTAFNFPENEFWIYPHVDHSGQFLFVADLGWYRLGEVRDVLPSELRTGLAPSTRGQRKADALVRTLAEVYRELALLHDAYALRYQDAADYMGLLDEQEILTEADIEREEGVALRRDAFGTTVQTYAEGMRTDLLSQQPHAFAEGLVARGVQEDAAARERREAAMPVAYSAVLADVPVLPLVARHARFLDADGTTRTEVYWALTPAASRLPDDLPPGVQPGAYLLRLTALQRTADFYERGRESQHLLVPTDGATLPRPQTVAFTGDAGTYHLAVQWDQHGVVSAANEQVRSGPRLATHVLRLDSLRALDAAPGLRLSDLRPETLAEGPGAPERGEPTPYPFGAITPETPLALYFEVYNLAFDAADATRYTVAYEVEALDDPAAAPLARLLRRGDEPRIAAGASYTGTSRIARERIGLDLSRWQDAGPVVITVRVRDEVTGAEATRSIRFRMIE